MVEARGLLILELLKSPADSARLVKMFLLDLDFKMWNDETVCTVSSVPHVFRS